MKDTTRLKKSRSKWASKAKARAAALRSMRKKLERRDHRINQLEKQLAAARSAKSGKEIIQVDRPITAQEVRVTCVFIVLFGVVSFRSVPRILSVLSCWLPNLKWIPHFTSVINWAMRVGLAKLSAIAKIATPWVALIDISIDEGTKKALTILRVPLDIMQLGRAITLADCACIGVIISEKWNGELVSQALEKVFENAGAPKAILMDGGKDLCKGVRLWKENTAPPLNLWVALLV